jgi:hypothetical protein
LGWVSVSFIPSAVPASQNQLHDPLGHTEQITAKLRMLSTKLVLLRAKVPAVFTKDWLIHFKKYWIAADYTQLKMLPKSNLSWLPLIAFFSTYWFVWRLALTTTSVSRLKWTGIALLGKTIRMLLVERAALAS